ncbi:MAG: DUF2007 domain-containing protein [Verrucomicrobia bacterium]|nr:DUF2007 domain-containing protein [Verrucomicrobiota bacterium]
MSCVFRHHLSSSQAHILAGVLSSNGVTAAVTGDIADQIYGGTPMLDCLVIVPEEEMEEAEAVLRTGFTEEPPTPDIPAETCPPDGDPPGVGDILFTTLCLAPLAALIPAVLSAFQILRYQPRTLKPVLDIFVHTYLDSLQVLIGCLPFLALGAGLLLRIIRGYRRGSSFCQLIFWLLALLFALNAVLSSRLI